MLINCNELLRLEALAKISSPLILNEPMLYLTLRKQILETLENGKDSVRDGSKTQFEQILDACALLGKACSLVGAKKDAEAFYRRAREGYVNLHGEDSEKALYATLSLFMSLGVKNGADIEKLKELAVRMERLFGMDGAIEAHQLCGISYARYGDNDGARSSWKRCLAYHEKTLGLKHDETLATALNLGLIYQKMGKPEMALEHVRSSAHVAPNLLTTLTRSTLLARSTSAP